MQILPLERYKKPIVAEAEKIQNQYVTQLPIQAQSQIQNTSYVMPQQISPPTAQVFQADQSEVVKMLQQMMEEMRSWRNPAQVQPLLLPQNYSQGSQAPQLGWGSPSMQTQSQ